VIYLVLLFAIPSRLVIAPLGSAGAISMLAGLVSLSVWALLWLAAVDARPAPPQPMHLALAVFMFSVGVSYALAMTHPISPDEISPADVALISLASWAGTMLIAHDVIRSRQRLDVLVWATSLAGGLMALLGAAQFLSKQPLVDVISLPGLTSLFDPALVVRNGLVRPSGTATHPIEYGTLLSLLLPIALHVGFHHLHRPWLLRWFPAVAIGGMIAISSSRSAYVSAVVALLVCLIGWSRRQRLVVLGSIAAGLTVLALAIPRLLRAVSGLFLGADSDPSIESRTDSYSFAWSFIVQHPLFGRGLGTLLPKYRIFDNQYLLLVVTVGIVGTLAFGALVVTSVVVLNRRRRQLRLERDRDLAISLTASIIAGFLSLAFFDAFAFPMTMGALFLVLGMAGAFTRLSDSEPEGDEVSSAPATQVPSGEAP
jgi:O-antigen ligase